MSLKNSSDVFYLLYLLSSYSLSDAATSASLPPVASLTRLHGSHNNWKLLAVLLYLSALKLAFAMCLPSSYTDLPLSVTLFLFRLNLIFSRAAKVERQPGMGEGSEFVSREGDRLLGQP